jgi:hypothetical protein
MGGALSKATVTLLPFGSAQAGAGVFPDHAQSSPEWKSGAAGLPGLELYCD